MKIKLKRQSMADLKRRHRGHFFSRDTMKFWGSTAHRWVYAGTEHWFFVTSEHQYDREGKLPRRHTVRAMNKQGLISTMDGFLRHAHIEDAREAARAAAKTELSGT